MKTWIKNNYYKEYESKCYKKNPSNFFLEILNLPSSERGRVEGGADVIKKVLYLEQIGGLGTVVQVLKSFKLINPSALCRKHFISRLGVWEPRRVEAAKGRLIEVYNFVSNFNALPSTQASERASVEKVISFVSNQITLFHW